jgi:imidazolonepropionase
MTFDLLLVDCCAAAMAGAGDGYGVIRDAAIGIKDGKLAYVGARAMQDARETRSLGGAWVTPGLIDCHTHLVFAGNRAPEWEMRAKGATYEEIARTGGGILSTVRATRAASESELIAQSLPRAQAMARQGVTTAEIKSGYGLDADSELKMLRAATKVGVLANINVSPTFLGAHTLPPEYRENRSAYVDRICNTMIPIIARDHLATAVDAFCESIAFTPEETERVFAAAKAHGLRVKLHAEQLSNSRGAILASKYDALSADHLEHLCDEGVATMAKAGMVAVLLPTAFYFLRETKKPPIEALRHAGVPLAIATDCNPGTSPVASPLIALNMACTLYGMTPEEALAGMTRNAAKALNSPAGTLESGKPADLAIWRISDPAELCYWIGADLLLDRYVGGKADRNWKAA